MQGLGQGKVSRKGLWAPLFLWNSVMNWLAFSSETDAGHSSVPAAPQRFTELWWWWPCLRRVRRNDGRESVCCLMLARQPRLKCTVLLLLEKGFSPKTDETLSITRVKLWDPFSPALGGGVVYLSGPPSHCPCQGLEPLCGAGTSCFPLSC